MDMKSRIKKPSQLSVDTGLKVLVYGAAGAGKTTLCTTTGAQDKTLIISAEAGLLSIRDSVCDAVSVSGLQDMRDLLAMLSKPDNRYTWIAIDSISEIAEGALAAAMEVNKDPRAAYGEMSTKLTALIKAFRDLPLNVVMACKGKQIEEDGRQTWQPLLPGKQLAESLPYLFDEVFCLVAKESEGTVRRALRTVSDGKYVAKDRSGRLDAWEQPDLAAIYKKIHGPRVTAA